MRFAALLAVVVVAASCAFLSETTEPAPWALTEAPDGAVLHVRALYGSSSCTSGHRWRVTESPDAVVVEAVYEKDRSAFCSAEAWFENATLTLEAPLAQRTLLGCRPDDGTADCRQIRLQPAPGHP